MTLGVIFRRATRRDTGHKTGRCPGRDTGSYARDGFARETGHHTRQDTAQDNRCDNGHGHTNCYIWTCNEVSELVIKRIIYPIITEGVKRVVERLNTVCRMLHCRALYWEQRLEPG